MKYPKYGADETEVRTMGHHIEMDIHSSKADRLEAGKILLANGYRVQMVIKRIGNARKTILIADKPEEEK